MLYALAASAANQAEEAHAGVDLPMAPVAFGIVAICILMGMLIATMGFRSVGTRH
ncbi:hypothetical protein ACFFKU_08730 [Kineococcus gynurae]|uniref:Uncharacterized protein n=1 Tax=Kineococcus gynurae TaxID=452979 RepID=A0ABV5LVZ9_9ACTN